MITPEQARERAERTFGDDVGIHEFDEGYIAWRAGPPLTDDSKPPSTVGGGVIVIDKESGEVTDWPMLAPDAIAEGYRRRKRGESTWGHLSS